MTDSESSPDQESRRRWRDFWQLHVPLIVVLAICTAATVIEARRATEGVWRAWAYMVEWPLIGVFAIWIWNRYRKHGTVIAGLGERLRAHAATYGASDRTNAQADQFADSGPAESADTPAPEPTVDPDLDAWRGYVDDLHRREPPGTPPAG